MQDPSCKNELHGNASSEITTAEDVTQDTKMARWIVWEDFSEPGQAMNCVICRLAKGLACVLLKLHQQFFARSFT